MFLFKKIQDHNVLVTPEGEEGIDPNALYSLPAIADIFGMVWGIFRHFCHPRSGKYRQTPFGRCGFSRIKFFDPYSFNCSFNCIIAGGNEREREYKKGLNQVHIFCFLGTQHLTKLSTDKINAIILKILVFQVQHKNGRYNDNQA